MLLLSFYPSGKRLGALRPCMPFYYLLLTTFRNLIQPCFIRQQSSYDFRQPSDFLQCEIADALALR